MPTFRNFQSNFTGGLLSEGMLGRVDLAAYENGCQQLDNWWPKISGGLRRRPGTQFLYDFGGNHPTRIEPFIFNDDQTYIVAFRPSELFDTEILIFDPTTGALLHSSNAPRLEGYRIKEMSVTQSADVMFCAHKDMMPLKITRTSATTFSVTNYRFEGDTGTTTVKKVPFIKFADADYTLEATGHTGVVTLSAADGNGDPVNWFTVNHVGYRLEYRGKQLFIQTVPVDPGPTCTAIVVEELDQGQRLFGSIGRMPDFIVGEIVVGRDSGTRAEVVEVTSGTILKVALIANQFTSSEQIEGLTSGNIASFNTTQLIAPPATSDWTEEAFSTVYGWPGIIEFHSQRLWLGGSSSLPAHIFGSKVAAFFNFDVGDALADESIQVLISDKQVNQVHDIVSGQHLYVFTDAGEYYAPHSDDSPLTPETFNLVRQTRYGSRKGITPRNYDEATIFVQPNGYAVREFIYEDRLRGYSSAAISLISEDAINDIQDMEVLYHGYDRPEQLALFVNGDGTIAWYHAARAEQVRSWGKWSTAGSFKSLSVINEKLYALVERTINGQTKMFLERFELDTTTDCTRYLTNGTAQTAWSAAHAELGGENVDVTAGLVAGDSDWFLGTVACSYPDGDVTLPVAVDNIGVGLPFTQTLEPMPYEVRDNQGVSGGLPKRLVSVDIYTASTLALRLNGSRIKTFAAESDWTQPPTPFTGSKKFYLFGYDERPSIVITNDIPLACEVLAINAEVEY